MMDFTIVKAHPLIVEYVDQLQRANVECLAFYPRGVFEREVERGRIMLSLLNGEPCGYLYLGSAADGTMRCHQVCIQYDARRRLYGAALVAALEEEAVRRGATFIRLRCGFDLQANEFWKSLNYLCDRTEDGGIRRMRRINVWCKAVSPALFAPVGAEPDRGTTSAAIWRKHKSTGIVTQFVRGAQMKAYRASVLSAALSAAPPAPSLAAERVGAMHNEQGDSQ